MRKLKWKRPNAYKHGAFATTTIVPGENPKEFEALHSDCSGMDARWSNRRAGCWPYRRRHVAQSQIRKIPGGSIDEKHP